MTERIQHQFHPARYAQLIENTEQVFLDGVLAEAELTRRLAIAQAVRDQGHHLLFPRSQQSNPPRIYHVQRGHLAQRFDQVLQLFAVGPYLSLVHILDALAQQSKRILGEAKQAAGAGAKGVYHDLAIIGRLREWGLESGAYILFLGRLCPMGHPCGSDARFSPEKNCDLLIQAYEQIDTPVKLVLAGGSSHSDAYVKRLREHQSDRVRVLDWVSGEALDELLTHGMLFVLPSDMEGLSLSLLDAMGAGVCVLASDVPENCQVVEDAGFTFRHGDRNDLERMLRLLISEPEIRMAAAGKARERVWEHYLWGRVAREIESQYLELASGNVPQPARPARVVGYRRRAA